MALEMISLKSQREIEAMRRAGRLTAQARALAGSMIRPGVTTHEIDRAVRRFIESHGAKPSFLGYGGFPASACISINEEVIHGIPGPRKLKEGDIVSVDVGAYIGGFHGDCAATYPCGQVSEEALRLIQVTQQSFWEGIKMARRGCRVSSGRRFRSMWSPSATPSSGTLWAMEWAPECTSPPRCATSAPPATAPGFSRG